MLPEGDGDVSDGLLEVDGGESQASGETRAAQVEGSREGLGGRG